MNNDISNINLQASGSILDAKLKGLNTAAPIKKNYTDEEKAQLAETARGFESIFVNMMFKSMKSAMIDSFSSDEKQDMTFGDDTLSGYTDMMFADHIAGSGTGIGIASMLYTQLTGEKLDSKASIPSYVPSPLRPQADTQENSRINFNFAGNNNNTAVSGNFIERVKNRIGNYEGIIEEAAEKYELPKALIKAVITTESAGNATAKSSVGAKGLMQLMDGTAKGLGVSNSYDPRQNIMGGAKYLRQMLNMFDGNLDHALAAYNAGPGNVRKYGGIPPFNETQNYVKKVKAHIRSFDDIV